MLGNQVSYLRLLSILRGAGSGRAILLKGPAHSGKETALRRACAESLPPEDVLFPDHGIESAREAVEFARFAASSGPVKCVAVVDADRLTDAGRDAYLKLCEETPDGCCVVLTSSNCGDMPPALMSRMRDVIEWAPLGADDMRAYAESSGQPDDEAIALACGLPGMYSRLAHQQRFKDLLDALRGLASGARDPVLDEPPAVVAKLDSKSDDRAAVVHLLRVASRSSGDPRARLAFLDYARTLSGSVSANAEIHWFRMTTKLLGAV